MTEKEEVRDTVLKYLGRAFINDWPDGNGCYEDDDSEDNFSLFEISIERVPEDETEDLEYWDVLLRFPSRFGLSDDVDSQFEFNPSILVDIVTDLNAGD